MKKIATVALLLVLLFCAGSCANTETATPPDSISVERAVERVVIRYRHDGQLVVAYERHLINEGPLVAGQEYLGFFTASRQKTSTATVWIRPGSSEVVAIDDSISVYYCNEGADEGVCQGVSQVVAAWREFLDADTRIREALVAPYPMPPAR